MPRADNLQTKSTDVGHEYALHYIRMSTKLTNIKFTLHAAIVYSHHQNQIKSSPHQPQWSPPVNPDTVHWLSASVPRSLPSRASALDQTSPLQIQRTNTATTVCLQQRDQNVFGNISYKTRAYPIKFGT